MRPAPTPDLLARFAAIVGAANALTDPVDIAPYVVEWRDLYLGRTPLVLKPGSTQEVAEVLKLAHETGTAIVPQGGNTGLVGGQTPDETGAEIVLSLSRLNRIRDVDPAGDTVTVEAGVVLQALHDAAAETGRLFPLTLGSMGSCQVGGNIATNAGGTAVLSYGNMRAQVLGLEVVLADGRIWNGLKRLHKDNSGYDMKQLFIGSEGTIGVITAAVLRLQPQPAGIEVAFVGMPGPEEALKLLTLARSRAGAMLTGFELMPRMGLEFTLRHLAGARDPLEASHDWYVLCEISSTSEAEVARRVMEQVLGEALEDGIVTDAAIAQSMDQAAAFWKLRHGMSEVQKHEGGSIKHDVSVPVDQVPAFLRSAIAAVEAFMPDCRPIPFGHLGDGNIHFNVSQPIGMDKEAYLANWDAMNEVVHAIVGEFGGSVAAEHGVGRLKRGLIERVKDPVELEMLRALKKTFDPKGILNPGRVV
ncbi:putative FAD-linked oxidoreductase [Hartmannibacter diazotrophicus]|uniref:Putative FAD-linked oxidoreductase n=1 Tax=Hartmannibacter diazotrophicus TaxID=1482074 RepID=A0A2C9D3A0_9HYPH|nr:FAD-binding oxidoreductase [Hartmannibacter diazotrophicus]SON54744.1 putative FAD-linked oxidoreductase [Hartmannibacter diazotrophicus]